MDIIKLSILLRAPLISRQLPFVPFFKIVHIDTTIKLVTYIDYLTS